MGQTEKKRSFSKLKKSMSYNEYEAFDRVYAKEYANSSNEFARSYFIEKYNVSESCHYKLLYDAVVYNRVSEEEVDKMEAKSISNQKAKVGGAGASSYLNYAKLRRERYKYIASLYTEKEIEDLVKVIIANPKISLQVIADIKGITLITLKYVIRRAIVECYIGDIEMMEIYERSIKNSKNQKNTEKIEKGFIRLFEERNSKIAELLSN